MSESWEHGRLILQGHKGLGSPNHAIFVGSDQAVTPRGAGGGVGTGATPVQEHLWLTSRRGRNDSKSAHVPNCPLLQQSVMEDP